MSNETELLLKLKAVDENLTSTMTKAVAAMEAQTNALVGAVQRLSPAQEQAGSGAGNLNTGMLNLAAGMSVLNTALELGKKAWEAVSEHVGKAIEEAEEAARASAKLTGAMISQGLYTEKNVKSINAYVKALEDSKGISGEQTQILVAQSMQMGLSLQQSMKMEEAARKLAVAQGVDANTAFQMLSGSIAGQTRGLAKIIPEVKNLTEAQLKNGAAADLVSKALDAQYKLYEGSYTASVKKAENAVSNIYEAVGKMITQNPIVLRAVQAFGDYAAELAENLDDLATWLRGNQELIERFGQAVANTMKVGAAALGVWAIAAGIAAGPTVILSGAIAVMTSPITLAIAAVAGLTAAFMKWPGLFDQIVGTLKMFAGMFIDSMTGIMTVAAKVAGVFDDELSASISNAKDEMQAYADKLTLAGARQIDLGTQINETAKISVKSVEQIKKEEEALNKNGLALSDNARRRKEVADSYAGITLGTEKTRGALESEVQQRDKDLKRFQQYLEDKKRLSISKKEEEQLQLAQIRNKEIGGTGGDESAKVQADAAVKTEQQKQAQLKMERQKGIITQKQLDEELFESEQRIREAQFKAATNHEQQMADLLGNGPSGYEAQRKIRQRKYDEETAHILTQAGRNGATIDQLNEISKQRQIAFQKEEFDAQKQHDQLMIEQETQQQQQLADLLGNGPNGFAAQRQVRQRKYDLETADMLAQAEKSHATAEQMDEIRKQRALAFQKEEFDAQKQHDQMMIDQATQAQTQLANVLENGPAGFEAQRQARQRKYNMETEAQVAAAQRADATQEQIDEIRKQRQLAYDKQEFENRKQHDQLMRDQATQAQRQKAEALGETPEALAIKKQVADQEFQMKLQQMTLEAQQEGATQAEINSMKEQQELEHKAHLVDIEVQYYENQAQLQEKSGNDWEAFLARRNAAVAQHGVVMGNIQAVTNSQYFKAEMQMLNDLSSLRSSKSKKQFEIGKAAAIAQASVQMFLGATQAFTSLSSIPIVGPVLGAIAAAAAIAAGMNNIQQIKAQQFQGGQADSGMNAIPQNLDGKSFVLSAGERVVQPTANKDLTDFLMREKLTSQQGGSSRSGGGNTYNITVNAGGLISQNETRKVAEVIVKEIRAMSEKGTPILSSKGVV